NLRLIVSLHDALPIWQGWVLRVRTLPAPHLGGERRDRGLPLCERAGLKQRHADAAVGDRCGRRRERKARRLRQRGLARHEAYFRSEEHTSELQSREKL